MTGTTVTACIPGEGDSGPCPSGFTPSPSQPVVAVIGTQDAPVTDFVTAFATGFAICWMPIFIAWSIQQIYSTFASARLD